MGKERLPQRDVSQIELGLATPGDIGIELASRGRWFCLMFSSDDDKPVIAMPDGPQSLKLLREFCVQFIEACDPVIDALEQTDHSTENFSQGNDDEARSN